MTSDSHICSEFGQVQNQMSSDNELTVGPNTTLTYDYDMSLTVIELQKVTYLIS